MREIKFKAWSGLTMYVPDYIDFTGGCYTSYSRWDSASVEKDENSILLQWTGLKDKNDKDIYEGDICQRKYFKNNIEVIELYKIFFDVGIFQCEKISSPGMSCSLGFYCTNVNVIIEVIGNIFENPEFLKN